MDTPDDQTLAIELVLHCAWLAGYEAEVIYPPAWVGQQPAEETTSPERER